MSISEIIDRIEQQKAFLPAIQRKFVWPRWKIEKLFDSLMRNYPIGSFLFWELNRKKAKEYVFYSFLKNYDERRPNNTRKKGSFRSEEIIGVLDGQQRLSSLFLGLQGTHRERLKYHKSKEDYAYPETFLCLNLLSLPYVKRKDSTIEEDKKNDFEFSFLTKEEAQKEERKSRAGTLEFVYWFRVGNVMDWIREPDIDREFEKILNSLTNEDQKNLFEENKRFVKIALTRLHKRTIDPLINYFKVSKDDLDDILKIFIRVNSGATILSKTDLLFSTIVATWEDGRDEIEAFMKDLNSKGDKFNFNNDFLMRSCLVLSDLPVLFKVNSFKSANVERIKDNWGDIKKALIRTVELLASFGFSGSVLTSQNAIIIIAYHFIKGGDNLESSKQEIRKYILHALLKNVYSGQGDQVIASFRSALSIRDKDKTYILKDRKFSCEHLINTKLPASKTLKITDQDIEEFMTYKKGANTFFVLSILYPHLRYNEVHFHQDHIHPDSGFTNAKLKDTNIPEEEWGILQDVKDTIPNLQLMEGRQNESKNATAFKKWLYGSNGEGKKNVMDDAKFKNDNFIPDDVGLELGHFVSFYTKRKELIIDELKTILNL